MEERIMFKIFGKRALAFILAMATVLTLLPVMPFASLLPEVTKEQTPHAHAAATGNHTPITGVTVNVSGATDNSMSSGAVTVTAKGSAGIFGFGASAKTATITIYNESGADGTLSFNWTATSVNNLVIDGTTYTAASGSFSKVLANGASITVTITTAKNGTTNKLVMSNFGLKAAQASSKVTVLFDSALGSVTVGGTATTSGSVHEISKNGAELKADVTSGKFLGWIDGSKKILSKNATYTLTPAEDMTVTAVFAGTTPWYLVNEAYLYDDWTQAMAAAQAASSKTVVLMNNATLPEGNYTVPASVTLLIPYNDANTLCTTKPNIATADGFESLAAISAYRTLTMATGANITVNGAISVSGTQHAGGRYCGNTSGPLGYIKMNTGSTITVNNGAFLYAWGYIMGAGTVTGKSGATIYESFQITDWRGGSVTSKVAQDTQGVFPMCQYFVQNIEVPMTLEAGAKEFAFMSVNITLIGVQDSAVPFIGAGDSGAMFRVAEGTVTKK